MRYIGKADNPTQRFYDHLATAGHKTHRGHWISSILSQGLVPEMQILFEIPQEGWQRIEKQFIRIYRQLGVSLVNGTDGGDGLSNPSEETRAKMSAAQKKRICSPETREKIRMAGISPETRAKISAAHKGRKRSPETCAKIRAAKMGTKHSPETIAKISASKKGKKLSLTARAKMSESQKIRHQREREKNLWR